MTFPTNEFQPRLNLKVGVFVQIRSFPFGMAEMPLFSEVILTDTNS